MDIAILTFEGFNEIDSFVSFNLLNRVPGLKAVITSPSETVTSTNGISIGAQQPLEFASAADAVLFGGSPRSREHTDNQAIMSRLKLDPQRQLIGSQCQGAWFLAKLGLLTSVPVCTIPRIRPDLEELGIEVLDQAFFAAGNIASAAGCLASPYLAAWVISRLAGHEAAETVLTSAAPLGQRAQFVAGILDVISSSVRDAESIVVNA